MSEHPGDHWPEVLLPASLNALRPLACPDLVRLGRRNDGGYVLPSCVLPHVGVLLSFGINLDWSFEEAVCRARPGLAIQSYDHTVGPRALWRRTLQALRSSGQPWRWRWHEAMRHLADRRRFTGFFSGTRRHFEERIGSGEGTTGLDRVFSRLDADSGVLLKCDIEGDEYAVFGDVLRHGKRLAAILIEFHDTQGRRAEFLRHVEHALNEFSLVHLHGNNWAHAAADGLPMVIELTLVRKDLLPAGLPQRLQLPVIGVDQPNRADGPDFRLRFSEST